MRNGNTANHSGWIKVRIGLVCLAAVMLTAACAGGAAPEETAAPVSTGTFTETPVPAGGATSTAGLIETPVTTTEATAAVGAATETALPTATLSAEQALASAPPLPSQSIPLQPSRVATELPLATPAGAAFSLPPTPVCAGLTLTPPDQEGPYYLDNTPERSSFIEPGMTGTRLIVTGYVVTPDCRPVPGARLEFWQAGPDGEYDLQGYRFRGHLFTEENGFYRLETILPAVYGGRPRHIHVKVLPQNAPALNTQLYFPGDSPFPELTVAYDEMANEALAVFNFVVAAP